MEDRINSVLFWVAVLAIPLLMALVIGVFVSRLRGGLLIRPAREDGVASACPIPHSVSVRGHIDINVGNVEDSLEVVDSGAVKGGLDPREYRVWFGTDRKPIDDSDLSRGFSGRRGGITHYGHCDVLVPESHKIGSIGSNRLRRLLTLTDDRLKVRRTRVLDRDVFWRAVREQLAEAAEDARHAVIFIHGYNVSFGEAALRAAQIGFDLGVSGAMAFFSWPSFGDEEQYPADGTSILASEEAIADFLASFGRNTGAEFVHVIAHSMGNRGVLRAINRILNDAQRRTNCQFGQFILAAADEDADIFRMHADAYRQLTKRTTLYVSARDRALRLSRWIYDYPRVGFEPPVSVFNGIDTISVTNLDLDALGHGYVAEARDVLSDMHDLIFNGSAPDKRAFLTERKTEAGQRYWEVRA